MGAATGEEMYALLAELFPLDRSLTGDGVRATLARLGELIPLDVHEVPTGTPVLDWTVPPEWNVRQAYIRDPHGRTVVDFADSNLHLVGYSVPVRRRMSLSELRPHLHTLPQHPDVIPYRTSYYQEDWGFCLRHTDLEELPEGEYEVVVDSRLEEGSLTYGECYVEGEVPDEVLLSCHVCHPSLANDNLSGVVVAAHAARQLARAPRRLSYRILFVPGTIGAIAWLARNRETRSRIRHGLVLSCLGDPGGFTYKRSRQGRAPVDRAAAHVLGGMEEPSELREFTPLGYDERQYCSPGFNLPVGRLTRTPNGEYPEYHTSADDLSLVRPDALARSLDVLLRIVDVLEKDRVWINRSPHGEPQLGRRGLYRAMGGEPDLPDLQAALFWVLNLADGEHSLLAMAERSGISVTALDAAARLLADHDLLEESPPG